MLSTLITDAGHCPCVLFSYQTPSDTLRRANKIYTVTSFPFFQQTFRDCSQKMDVHFTYRLSLFLFIS